MGLQPVFPGVYIGAQRHGVLHTAFHLFPQDGSGLFGFCLRGLHDQLVVDCQDQAALHVFRAQTPPDPHHCQLDDVGGCALNGGVAGHPLAAGPDVPVGAGQFRQGAAASEQGGDIAAVPGVRNGLVHRAAHFGERGQIVLEEGVCFLDRHADVLG